MLFYFRLQCGVTLTTAYVLAGLNRLSMTLIGRLHLDQHRRLLLVRLPVKVDQVRTVRFSLFELSAVIFHNKQHWFQISLQDFKANNMT